MKTARFAAVPAFAIVASLAGCAVPAGEYPSLARRPIESLDTAEPVATTPSPAPLDAAIATRVTALLAEAEAGEGDFAAALAVAAPRIRAGATAATGSDPWIAAQEAASRLSAARNRTAAALQSLDALAIEQGDEPAIAAARDRAAALDAAQAARLAELEARLPA